MKRLLSLLALVTVAVIAAACSSNTSSTATSTSTTTTEPVTTTTAVTTTTSASGPTECSTSTLSISVGQGSGAAGHVISPLIMKNTSSVPCQTGGFPGVAGTNSSGAQVIQATRSGPSKGLVTLSPGASASALLSAVDVPSGTATSCPTLAGLAVTPPNTTAAAQVSASLPGCPGLSVTALVSGTSGQ